MDKICSCKCEECVVGVIDKGGSACGSCCKYIFGIFDNIQDKLAECFNAITSYVNCDSIKNCCDFNCYEKFTKLCDCECLDFIKECFGSCFSFLG